MKGTPEDPYTADDLKDMTPETLREGLAFWMNEANLRGNKLFHLVEVMKEKDKLKEALSECSEYLKRDFGAESFKDNFPKTAAILYKEGKL